MTKSFFISLLILLGFFLTPGEIFACDTQNEKIETACCKKENTTNDNHSCTCKKDPAANSNESGCSGEMQHTSCHCPVKTPVAGFTIRTIQYSFLNAVQLSFTDLRSYTLSGFDFIWLPPKLG